MAGLEELTLALRAGSQGKANLAGLDEQYDRASKLRDTPMSGPDKYGQLSPMMAMADVLRQSRGRKQMREIGGQREAARSAIAENENVGTLFNAKRAVDKTIQDQSNFEATAAAGLKAAKVKAGATLKARQRVEQREDEKVPTDVKVDPKTGMEHTVRYNAQTGVATLDNGEVIEDYSKWTDPVTKTQVVTGAGGYGGEKDDKESRAYRNTIRNVDFVYKTMEDITPDQEKMLNSGMYRAKMALLETVTPEKFQALVTSEFNGYDPATRKMMIALHGMSGEERKRLFGSALTKPELMSSQEFLAGTIGKGLGFVRDALADTKNKNVDGLLGVDAQYGKTKYFDMLVSEGVINKDYTRTSFELGAEPAMGSAAQGTPAAGAYEDADEEALYQQFKAQQAGG